MEAVSMDGGAQRVRLPALQLSNGALEASKWIALVLMTLDHVNKYLWHDAEPVTFALGRLAMPIFAVVLGFNLARCSPALCVRIARRLTLFGAAASLPFIALGGLGWGWWPLNIMATLTVATVICVLLNAGGKLNMTLAAALFVIGGSSVEFWWPGVALCVATWSYARAPSWRALVVGAFALGSLRIINGNDWAIVSIVPIAAMTYWRWPVPRLRYLFYAFYPLHLGVLWLVRNGI